MAEVIDLHKYIKDNHIVTKADVQAALDHAKNVKFFEEVKVDDNKVALKFSSEGAKVLCKFLVDMHDYVVATSPEENRPKNLMQREISLALFCRHAIGSFSNPSTLLVSSLAQKIMTPEGKFNSEVFEQLSKLKPRKGN